MLIISNKRIGVTLARQNIFVRVFGSILPRKGHTSC